MLLKRIGRLNRLLDWSEHRDGFSFFILLQIHRQFRHGFAYELAAPSRDPPLGKLFDSFDLPLLLNFDRIIVTDQRMTTGPPVARSNSLNFSFAHPLLGQSLLESLHLSVEA